MGSAGYSCVIVSQGIQINGLAVWLLGDPHTLHVCKCVNTCARGTGDNKCGLTGSLFFILLISYNNNIKHKRANKHGWVFIP